MKTILRGLCLALALACAPSFAAIAHVASSAGACTSATTATGNIANVSTTCGASSSSTSFTYTAAATGNLLIFAANCAPVSGTITSASASATGWTFTQIFTPQGAANQGFFSAWWATAPNTSAATINVSWSGACGSFVTDYTDEFSGASATAPIDNHASLTGTTGGCSVSLNSITPTANNDALWALCYVATLTGVGSGFTKGADDGVGDWTEYKILTGGGGTSQSVTWNSSGDYIHLDLAIAPSGGVTAATMPAAVY